MKFRAVTFVAIGIAGLFVASVAGAVVVAQDDGDEVSTDASATSTLPPDEGLNQSAQVDPGLTVLTDVPAGPVSIVPVPPVDNASTTTVAPAPTPVLVRDPAPCETPKSQPAAGDPAGPVGVFTVGIGDGAVRLTNPIGRLPAWRPKTGQVVSVAVASGKQPGLCLSGPDGAGAKPLNTPVGAGRPALSSNGAKLAVRSGRAGMVDLIVGSVEGTDQKVILQSSEVGDPVWLGNGSVVTCAQTGGARRLVAVPADGGEPRVLRTSCPRSPVSSAPDGSRIAFALADQVVVLNVSSRVSSVLRFGAVATAAAPTWSPDGKRVAFAYSDAQGSALGMLDLDARRGSTPFRSPGISSPSWAPAGDLLGFVATRGDGRGLSVVKPDGTGPRLVATCSTSCSLAAQPWASDGSSVVLELSGAAG